MNKQSLTSTIIFALAIIIASLLLKQGIVEFKTLDRSVAVKGLAEKEVMANTVIWPINYSLAGNDLTKLIDELEAKNQAVRAFLEKNKQPKNDIIILLSDAEEIGLLGAQAFVDFHPWTENVG